MCVWSRRSEILGFHAHPQGDRGQPRQVFDHTKYAKPYHFKGSAKSCWQTDISVPILAKVGRKDKAHCKNVEKG